MFQVIFNDMKANWAFQRFHFPPNILHTRMSRCSKNQIAMTTISVLWTTLRGTDFWSFFCQVPCSSEFNLEGLGYFWKLSWSASKWRSPTVITTVIINVPIVIYSIIVAFVI